MGADTEHAGHLPPDRVLQICEDAVGSEVLHTLKELLEGFGPPGTAAIPYEDLVAQLATKMAQRGPGATGDTTQDNLPKASEAAELENERALLMEQLQKFDKDGTGILTARTLKNSF